MKMKFTEVNLKEIWAQALATYKEAELRGLVYTSKW